MHRCWLELLTLDVAGSSPDRMINPKTQHFMANRMKATTRSLAVDHTPLVSAPQKVVDIILEAKQAVSSANAGKEAS